MPRLEAWKMPRVVRWVLTNIYMTKILEQIESKKSVIGGILTKEQLNGSFKQNCIPDEFVNYDVNNYYEFLARRRYLMSQKIRDYYFSL